MQALGPVKQIFDSALAARRRPMNPYLTGVHTPMRSELTIENLPVTGVDSRRRSTGVICGWGRTPWTPSPSRYHWFAGDGMVHGISIETGSRASGTAIAGFARPA